MPRAAAALRASTSASGVKCRGDQISAPTDVPGLTSGVFAIAAGLRTCAVVGDAAGGGGVQCRGANDTGQLGERYDDVQLDAGQRRRSRQRREGDRGGRRTGRSLHFRGHTCAITTDGGVKCWGWNAAGQLGDDIDRRTGRRL